MNDDPNQRAALAGCAWLVGRFGVIAFVAVAFFVVLLLALVFDR